MKKAIVVLLLICTAGFLRANEQKDWKAEIAKYEAQKKQALETYKAVTYRCEGAIAVLRELEAEELAAKTKKKKVKKSKKNEKK